MKTKFKNYLRLGLLLFSLSFTLTNCEKDDSQSINISNNETLRIENISLSTFKNKKAVFKKINKLTANDNNKLNRTVYDSENNFYINTDEVVLIEKDGFHWLTFSIKRNSNSTGLENLVLRQNITNNTYLAYLAKYAISDNEINTIRNGGTVNDIENKVTFQSLISFNSDIFARDRIIHQRPDGSCFSHGTTIYGDNDEVIGMTEIPVECPEYLTSDTGNGSNGGGGGSGTPDDGCSTCPDYEGIPIDNTGTESDTVGTGPGGTASGDTTTTETDNNTENTGCLTSDVNDNCISILTTPKPEPTPDPCSNSSSDIQKLNELFSNDVIKDEIDEQVAHANSNATTERGKEFRLELDGTYTAYDPISVASGETEFEPTQGNTIIHAHAHVDSDGQDPIPSPEDIANGFIKFYHDKIEVSNGNLINTASNNDIVLLTVTTTGVFAFKVNNPQQLINSYAPLVIPGTHWKNLEITYKKRVQELSSEQCIEQGGCTPEEHNEKITNNFNEKIMKKYLQLGISYYKGTKTPLGTYIWTCQNGI